MRKHLPDANWFVGRHPPELPGYVVAELVGSGGNGHVFRAHSDHVNNDMACKVIPRANLVGADMDPPLWKGEILKPNALESSRVVHILHSATWTDSASGIDCVALYSPFIQGTSLRDYIGAHKRDVPMLFVKEFLREMLALLDDMERHNVVHGDLHAGNILVEDRTHQLGGARYVFRVTDFGVAPATTDSQLKDDYDEIAVILRDLLANVDYQGAEAPDKFAFNYLNDNFLARHLAERDTTRDPLARRPRRLYEELQALDARFDAEERAVTKPKLQTLFDYLSCEQIGDDDGLLRALYSEEFLRLPEIERSRSNLVLTGPRGCGKSTVFRSLSLRHRTLVEDDDPKSIAHIGIYYRCYDLWLTFPRYALPAREEAYDVPMHYLTSTLVCSALEAIERWAARHFSEELGLREAAVAERLWGILNEEAGLRPRNEPGSNKLEAIRFCLQKERQRAVKKQRFVNDPSHPMRGFFGPGSLLRVCDALAEGFSFARNRPFFFFIDDYSMPKVTRDLQKNLNRLLMQRTARCFFKLSTESPVSYVREDMDGKAYVEGREFTLLNLGLEYLQASSAEKLQFIADVLARRFANIEGFPVGSLAELAGDYEAPSYNETALAIRRGEIPELWGQQTLCELCSGDIFYIIGLVARMVEDFGGEIALSKSDSTPRIDKKTQRTSIRKEAGSFLTSLRVSPDGQQLVQIVTAFGNVAHSYMKFRDSRNESGSPPHLASRIEPYEELALSRKAKLLYDELLRYSLFIEDPRGKSRRGQVVPRLYLRRCLIPHFNLTFSRRDSVELEPHEVEQLLLNPQEFEREHRLKTAELTQWQEGQQRMFRTEGQEDL